MTGNYDYIVVGGGSAGSIVANRLSVDPNNRVILLEAGTSGRNPLYRVPLVAGKLSRSHFSDWNYKTEPDPGLNNRSLDWPRGKTLGGSSSINGLLYVRGQPQDFNHWRQLGNSGWSWEDVLPLFKRSESWEGQDDGIRGQEGPLTVSRNRVNRGIVDAWLAAAVG